MNWIKVEDQLPVVPINDHCVDVLASWQCPCGDTEHCGDWHVNRIRYTKDGKWMSWAVTGNGMHVDHEEHPAYWQYVPEPPFLSKWQQRRKDSAIAAAGKEST